MRANNAQADLFNAVFVEQAGDVVGYELVFLRNDGHSIAALLYVYEGVPNKDGISVSGQVSSGRLRAKGDWVQHLVEEPSKKEVIQTWPVELSGALDSKRFRGTIKVSGVAHSATLKRVSSIWMCRGS